MKWKENIEPIPITDDYYYMLVNGGYIKPSELLDEADAKKVNEALEIIKQFIEEGEDNGIFEEY